MSSKNVSALERLGAAVQKRRTELDLSQLGLAQAGGPSTTTISKMEQGIGPAPTSVTLRRLDTALQWTSGSARALYEKGTEPRVEASQAALDLPGVADPRRPVGAGVDPGLLADAQQLSDEEVQRVRDFIAGIRSGG